MRRNLDPAGRGLRRMTLIRVTELALILASTAGLPGFSASAAARHLNGFQIDPASIPVGEIERGGPPRDGIPALESPDRLAAADSPWLDSDWVVGVEIDGEARAYPLAILIWHELVNDELGGLPILVSYCPLCGTALVFERNVAGQVRLFGVSGLLYRSDLLMFDRESESLWSQISARSVTGASRGERLTLVRSRMLPWGRWRSAHPETTVLTRKTGYQRQYGHSPYGDYDHSDDLLFSAPLDSRHHAKMPTLGLRVTGGPSRAYPSDELEKAGGRVRERFAGRDVTVAWDAKTRVFSYEVPNDVNAIRGFWFAWMAFHPKSSVYIAPTASEEDPAATAAARGVGLREAGSPEHPRP